MILNGLGEIVIREWHNTASRRHYFNLGEFIVMPNHVHGIIWLTGDRVLHDRGTARCAPTEDAGLEDRPARTFGSMVPGSLSSVVRGFKSAATRSANDYRNTPGDPLWQRNYYERVIRDDRLHDVRQYIVNPARWAGQELRRRIAPNGPTPLMRHETRAQQPIIHSPLADDVEIAAACSYDALDLRPRLSTICATGCAHWTWCRGASTPSKTSQAATHWPPRTHRSGRARGTRRAHDRRAQHRRRARAQRD
jgi:REP element-mobilizing transposase RayT